MMKNYKIYLASLVTIISLLGTSECFAQQPIPAVKSTSPSIGITPSVEVNQMKVMNEPTSNTASSTTEKHIQTQSSITEIKVADSNGIVSNQDSNTSSIITVTGVKSNETVIPAIPLQQKR